MSPLRPRPVRRAKLGGDRRTAAAGRRGPLAGRAGPAGSFSMGASQRRRRRTAVLSPMPDRASIQVSRAISAHTRRGWPVGSGSTAARRLWTAFQSRSRDGLMPAAVGATYCVSVAVSAADGGRPVTRR